MNEVATLIADMVRAGVDPELIGRAAAALSQNVQIVQDPAAERRREKDRERKRLRNSAESMESAETPSPKKEIPPTPPKEKTTPSVSASEARAEFDQFWAAFPNKVGKRDAEREFGLALKRASFTDIIAGLRRYVAKTDDRPWCNPSTFLHQDRWADMPASPQRNVSPATSPPRKQTVGQQARDELKRMGLFDDTTSPQTRHIDQSDGGPGFAGTGIARRIAIASSR